MTFRYSLLAVALLAFALTARADDAPKLTAKQTEFFEKKIRPVLVKHCYRCHSPSAKRLKGNLDLSTRASTRKGGEIGPAVVPGEPATSLIMQALRYEDDLEMPPDGQLDDEVIEDFETWIEMGAPDPRDGKAKTDKPKYAPSKDWWSLQPLKTPAIPEVKDKDWARSDIDRFLLHRMEKAELQPVADAPPLQLLRRTYYDLIGLPPSPEVIDAFAKDHSPEAFTRIVDELLKSPRFGERWGRHWLDVARFAESNGKDRDAIYPHAWRYRRYVIKSINEDKPYDQFIREQIAGDLLPTKTPEEKETNLIATGFLALGPKPFMKRGEQQLMDIVDDQIDATSRAVLGLTVSCARCHDHKFDPIPTRDYYSLAGIFRSTNTLYGSRNKGGGNLIALADKPGDVKKPAPAPKANPRRVALQKRLKEAQAALAQAQKLKGANKQKMIQAARRQIKQIQNQLQRLGDGPANANGKRFTMGASDANNPRDLNVLIRGEVNKRGPAAPRGFLSSVPVKESIKVNPKQSGRLELARWLTHDTNPLTSRVAVNRIWHHLFGRGLVRTTDNLGANGEKPTHPELLDYLAIQFVEDGWSTKRMIRRIVLSRAYQLGGIYSEKNYEVDPDNTLVWRHSLRRMDVEAIRDTMLSASGKLDLTPPKQSPVALVGVGEVGRGINTKPIEAPFFHRSVYLPVLRTSLLEVLKIFDFAEPSLVVGQRTITTVPAQALYMMNNPFVVENAQTLADVLLKEKMSDAERIDLAYKRALARLPLAKEQQRALAYLDRFTSKLQTTKVKDSEQQRLAWTSFCQALFANAEFRYLN